MMTTTKTTMTTTSGSGPGGSNNQLPTVEAVRGLLGPLLDRPVTVARLPGSQTLALTPKTALATFIADDGQMLYAMGADVGFIASVGAALAMIPPAMAMEALKSGVIPETILLNAQEVLNIGASIFNTHAEVVSAAHTTTSKTHVRLEKLVFGSQDAALLKKIQTSIAMRIDLTVTTPGYPEGKLAVLALKKTG